jgi:signal transduction histidine kinase
VQTGWFLTTAAKFLTCCAVLRIRPIHLRLAGLAALIVGSATLFGWSALANWRRFAELHDGLQLAQRFEEQVITLQRELNRLMLNADPDVMAQVVNRSHELHAWIEAEKEAPHTARQQRMLEQIGFTYAGYLANVEELAAELQGDEAVRLTKATALQEQLLGLLQESLAEFFAEARQGLFLRQALTFALLAVLLLLLAWLALAVYRGMIAPLRVQLIEAGAAVEQSQKLAALGVLAAGIAHEIRNPLTAIKARLFTHQRSLSAGTRPYENTEFIGRELDRLERIVREFLLFARPADPVLAPAHTSELLRETADLLGPEVAKHAIELRVEPQPDLPVQVDRQHIQQVLINLVRNAAESIEEKGRIVLRTRRGRAPLGGVVRPVAIIEVEDNGKGIPPEAQTRLFDPFFTTKPNGTGLGLSIAARIVEKQGGALRYQTQVNRGTTFGIVLPLESK